jgi:hypothetical protein
MLPCCLLRWRAALSRTSSTAAVCSFACLAAPCDVARGAARECRAYGVWRVWWRWCRTTKQCRERWLNVLDPSIKRTAWTKQELDTLFRAQEELGNKWCVAPRVAASLLGSRTNTHAPIHPCVLLCTRVLGSPSFPPRVRACA